MSPRNSNKRAFEDMPWFPDWIRVLMTRYIMTFHKILGTAGLLEKLVEKGLQNLAGMNWRDFSVLLDTAFTRQGYTVTPLTGAADMLLEKKGVRTVVSAKRWKAAAMGLEPLRELVAHRDALEASNSVCISLGQVSTKAEDYAAEHRITLITGADLVILVDKEVKAL